MNILLTVEQYLTNTKPCMICNFDHHTASCTCACIYTQAYSISGHCDVIFSHLCFSTNNVFLFFECQDYPINPKSLSLGELYGEFDLNTNEWSDGVLSSVMRNACAGEYLFIHVHVHVKYPLHA